MMGPKKRNKKRIQKKIEAGIKRTGYVALAAEGEALSYLIDAERRYTTAINKLRKQGLTGEALDQAEQDLMIIQVEVDSILEAHSKEWAEKYAPRAYLEGRSSVEATLEVMAATDRNVRDLMAVFRNFQWDEERKQLILGSYESTRATFTEWNKGTADWLRKEFADARREGIPMGNYSDIGTDRDTLVNRLYREPGRFRGRTATDKNGKVYHIPAERTALNHARIEMVKIENEAAELEAQRIGLDHCYNANPEDSNTTRVCRKASKAGNLPKSEMISKYGKPPRLDPFHLCRSMLVYTRPEWV